MPEPILNLSWPYKNPYDPTPEELAKELNGRALADSGRQARITNPRAIWWRTNQIIPSPGTSDTTVIAMTSPISV